MLVGISEVVGGYNETAEAALIALDQAAGLRPFVAVMPEAANVAIPALGTFQARVSVPVGALLWGISGKSAQAAGATVQVTDSKTQKPLFSQDVNIGNVAGGSLSVPDAYGTVHSYTGAVHVLPKAMIVVSPGLLTVKIVNLAAVVNNIQLALHFSLPNPAGVPNPNAYNDELNHELDLAIRAIRDPGSGNVLTSTTPAGSSATPATPAPTLDLVDSLFRVAFDISTVGDNTIIPGNTGLGKISIYQLDLWNATAAQDIGLKDGPNPLRGTLANFPAQMGYALTFQDAYHFQLTPGNSFVINISGGTRLTGFVRYRME